MELSTSTCYSYGSTLDCSSQNIVSVPSSVNFSPFQMINLQHDRIAFADIRGYGPHRTFDIRNNENFSCKGIRYDKNQPVYPCNPHPESEDNESERKDRKKEKKKLTNSKILALTFGCLGGFFAVMVAVGLVWYIRKEKMKERERVASRLSDRAQEDACVFTRLDEHTQKPGFTHGKNNAPKPPNVPKHVSPTTDRQIEQSCSFSSSEEGAVGGVTHTVYAEVHKPPRPPPPKFPSGHPRASSTPSKPPIPPRPAQASVPTSECRSRSSSVFEPRSDRSRIAFRPGRHIPRPRRRFVSSRYPRHSTPVSRLARAQTLHPRPADMNFTPRRRVSDMDQVIPMEANLGNIDHNPAVWTQTNLPLRPGQYNDESFSDASTICLDDSESTSPDTDVQIHDSYVPEMEHVDGRYARIMRYAHPPPRLPTVHIPYPADSESTSLDTDVQIYDSYVPEMEHVDGRYVRIMRYAHPPPRLQRVHIPYPAIPGRFDTVIGSRVDQNAEGAGSVDSDDVQGAEGGTHTFPDQQLPTQYAVEESKPECVSSLHVLEPELINKAVSGHEFDVQDEVLQLINKAVKRLREETSQDLLGGLLEEELGPRPPELESVTSPGPRNSTQPDDGQPGRTGQPVAVQGIDQMLGSPTDPLQCNICLRRFKTRGGRGNHMNSCKLKLYRLVYENGD